MPAAQQSFKPSDRPRFAVTAFDQPVGWAGAEGTLTLPGVVSGAALAESVAIHAENFANATHPLGVNAAASISAPR